jgi:hypothetical protein
MSDTNNSMSTTNTAPAAPAYACNKPTNSNPAQAQAAAPAQGTRPVTPKSARRQARKQQH